MNEIDKKLIDLTKGRVSGWQEKARKRQEGREWKQLSAYVALQIHERLIDLKLKKKDLAELLGVSPQQVSKITRGEENLTLETIGKLQKALEFELRLNRSEMHRDLQIRWIEDDINKPQNTNNCRVYTLQPFNTQETYMAPFQVSEPQSKEEKYG